MSKMYGYARVSAKHQNEDRQSFAMMKVGIPEKNIFVDKQSGKDFERTQYQKMLTKLRRNDVLFIKSIDRLGRNYNEIIEQWGRLTKEMGVDIVVIDLPLLDTRCGRDLIGTFISDVVLQILSFVAENERTNILQRQREGIEVAKLRGVRFGRPERSLPANFKEVVEMWNRGYMTASEAARICAIPLATFRNRALKTLRRGDRPERLIARPNDEYLLSVIQAIAIEGFSPSNLSLFRKIGDESVNPDNKNAKTNK